MSTQKPNSVEMTLHRDYILRTTKGHSVQFKAGEPTRVPIQIYPEAIAIGAQRVDKGDANVLPDDKAVPVLTPAEREELLHEAIRSLLDRNERDDFTTTGQPTVAAVMRESGEKFDAKEVTAGWKAVTVPEQ